ncbi:MAG: hypothetical protein ACRC2M_20105 [Planktothrix sp.]
MIIGIYVLLLHHQKGIKTNKKMSKQSKNKLAEVMKKAWEKVRIYKIKIQVALKWAWSEIKNYSPVVEIEFVKKEGEVAKRIATDLKAKDEANVLFFSISDNGFRKAIAGNILSIRTKIVTI